MAGMRKIVVDANCGVKAILLLRPVFHYLKGV